MYLQHFDEEFKPLVLYEVSAGGGRFIREVPKSTECEF